MCMWMGSNSCKICNSRQLWVATVRGVELKLHAHAGHMPCTLRTCMLAVRPEGLFLVETKRH